MTEQKLTFVKMSDPREHPVFVGVGRNEIMGCWEVSLTYGNFADRPKAEAAGRRLVKYIEAHLGVTPGEEAKPQ